MNLQLLNTCLNPRNAFYRCRTDHSRADLFSHKLCPRRFVKRESLDGLFHCWSFLSVFARHQHNFEPVSRTNDPSVRVSIATLDSTANSACIYDAFREAFLSIDIHYRRWRNVCGKVDRDYKNYKNERSYNSYGIYYMF